MRGTDRSCLGSIALLLVLEGGFSRLAADTTVQPQEICVQTGEEETVTISDPDCTFFYLTEGFDDEVIEVDPQFKLESANEAEFTVTGLLNGQTPILLSVFFTGSICEMNDPLNIEIPVSVGDCPEISTSPTVGQTPNAGTTKDPVSTATGELFAFGRGRDLSLGGPLPLGLIRSYAAFLKLNDVTSALGDNWMHNFDLSLAVEGDSATVTLFRGRQVKFNLSGNSWQLVSTEQFDYQLASVDGSFQFLDRPRNLIYTFSDAGALTKIEDRNGNALNITPSATASGPDSVFDPVGRTLSFTYTAGKLTSVEDQTGRQVLFIHNGDELASFTDAGGNTTTYNYATQGEFVALLVAEALPEGNVPYTQTYDSQGRVTRQDDSRGNPTTLVYEKPAAGGTTLMDPLNNTTVHLHQEKNNLTEWTDANGNSISLTYDANNRLIATTDRLGNTASRTYDGAGNLTSITDALRNTTSFLYTAQTQGPFTFCNLTGVDFPDGATWRLSYDNAGNLLTFTDRAGKVTTWTRNSRGQPLTVSNAAGGVITFTYNDDGTPASRTLPSGDTTSFEYDNLKRPVKLNYADGASSQLQYDNRNQLLGTTDERGKTLSFSYDANRRLETITDPSNQTASFAYDGDDRLTALIDRTGSADSRSYDELGRLISAVNPAGDPLTFSYDRLDRVTSVSDGAGEVLELGYDSEGRLTSAADGLVRTWQFTSDALGRLSRLANPLGNVTQFSYDSMGRVVSLTDPLSQTREFSYDSRGQLNGVTLPAGIAASFAYSDLGRLAGVTDPNGNVWTRNYDSSGRLASRSDPLSRTMAYTYDTRQRPSVVNLPEGTLSFTYDEAGNLLRRLYSDGTDLQYSYDDNNRLVAATGLALAYDAEGRITDSNGLSIARDSMGRIAAVTYAPGKTVTYEYNSQGLLSRLTDWLGGVTQFSYDQARQLSSITRPNGVTTQYTYAADGRLAGITETGANLNTSIQLTRDTDGKVVSARRDLPRAPVPAPTTQDLTYDAAHQINSFTYDQMGRLVSDGTRTYTWDLASRLTGFRNGGGTGSFQYDALGLMITGARNYVWNYALGLPSIAVEREGQADVRYHVHLPNGVLLYSINAATGARHYYHFDEMGNTVMLSDDNGVVTDSYAVTPYGEVLNRTGNTTNRFTFQGAFGVMEIGTSGLYYMRARFYAAATARFLSRDPVLSLEPRSIGPYQYAKVNPLRFSDPTGLSPALHARFLTPGSPFPGARFTEQQRWVIIGSSFGTTSPAPFLHLLLEEEINLDYGWVNVVTPPAVQIPFDPADVRQNRIAFNPTVPTVAPTIKESFATGIVLHPTSAAGSGPDSVHVANRYVNNPTNMETFCDGNNGCVLHVPFRPPTESRII